MAKPQPKLTVEEQTILNLSRSRYTLKEMATIMDCSERKIYDRVEALRDLGFDVPSATRQRQVKAQLKSGPDNLLRKLKRFFKG